MNLLNVNVAALGRYATVGALAIVALSAGVAFSLKGGTDPVECKTEYVSCTGTGGLAKYPYCNWQEPVDDSGSGSVVIKLYWTVGDSPAVISVDWTVGTSLTTSGSVQSDNNATSSGSWLLYGYGNAFKVGSGEYLRGVTLTDPTSDHTATLMLEYCTIL